MRVVFLGVGEAFDEVLPNTSVWIETEIEGRTRTILLDCGFTVPSAYWRMAPEQKDLDALWISHFHGDHFFGVPALLLRFWEMKREKPLTIVGQTGIERLIHDALNLAYPGFMKKLGYPLEFISVEPSHTLYAVGLNWRFAENGHGQRDLAVRVDDGKSAIFYSGDGLPTEQTLELAGGCDLIIHEAFGVEATISGHGSIIGCIEFARKAGVPTLALVHIQRSERRGRYKEMLALCEQTEGLHVLIPEPGDEMEL